MPEIAGLAFVVIGAAFISYVLVVVGKSGCDQPWQESIITPSRLSLAVIAVCWELDS